LDNLLIGITRSNCINFHEILCRYEALNVKNLKQLVLKSNFYCILLMSYEKLVFSDIHIEVLIWQSYNRHS
jgi:hypothetical protein